MLQVHQESMVIFGCNNGHEIAFLPYVPVRRRKSSKPTFFALLYFCNGYEVSGKTGTERFPSGRQSVPVGEDL